MFKIWELFDSTQPVAFRFLLLSLYLLSFYPSILYRFVALAL